MSLTVGLGIDGGFVTWSAGSEWPRPEELADDMLLLRCATLVDTELRAALTPVAARDDSNSYAAT